MLSGLLRTIACLNRFHRSMLFKDGFYPIYSRRRLHTEWHGVTVVYVVGHVCARVLSYASASRSSHRLLRRHSGVVNYSLAPCPCAVVTVHQLRDRRLASSPDSDGVYARPSLAPALPVRSHNPGSSP